MLLPGAAMIDIELDQVRGGVTLAQCFKNSNAAYVPAMPAGALAGYMIRPTGRATLIGTAGGFIAAVGLGCLNS